LEVLDVAAMAAGVPGLRAGVGAVTLCRAGGVGAATGGDNGAVAMVFGGALCAADCDFGSERLSFFPVVLAACLSAAFFAVDLSLDFLAAGFSAVLPAVLSAPFLAAGFSFASVAAGLAGLAVSADAKGPNATIRLAASAVDRRKRASKKGFTAVLRRRIVQEKSDLAVVDGND
jgi:hypothetical protein